MTKFIVVFRVYIHKKRGWESCFQGKEKFYSPSPTSRPSRVESFTINQLSVVVFDGSSANAYVPVTPSSIYRLMAARAADLSTMFDWDRAQLRFCLLVCAIFFQFACGKQGRTLLFVALCLFCSGKAAPYLPLQVGSHKNRYPIGGSTGPAGLWTDWHVWA